MQPLSLAAPRSVAIAVPAAPSAASAPASKPASALASALASAPAGRIDPRTEYRRALAALRRGEHDEAVAGLRAFLERFPRHSLVDNVQYYVAESYYRRGLYAEALTEYQTLVDRYWRGNKLPHALLKIGLCHASLGRREAARAALRRLVARFPDSRPARQARTRLQELASR
jgi:tol-pal system protein YbgF